MALISMNSKNSLFCLCFFLFFAAIFPYDLNATYNKFEMDEFLEKRAKEALQESVLSYNPNPEEVTSNFEEQVGEFLQVNNMTRRHLGERGCKATNPFDRCWRCDKNWAKNRKRLVDCVRGFGRGTTGGLAGKYYLVTDPSDNDVVNPKPGTLRHAVIQEKPLWIIFAGKMRIKLKEELLVTSHKTIDGRGADVDIANGAGLTLQFVKNIIICHIKIHHVVPARGGLIRDSTLHLALRTMSDGDAISIFGSNHIWIDHVSLYKCTDGLIDVIMASTAITISNCKFNHHNDVMLLGANDAHGQDAIMQVTVAFNRFGKGLIQRMPRCRWGFFHIVNNDYAQWDMYAIGGSAHPTIISQGNRFKASRTNPYAKQVTHRDYAQKSKWGGWQWRSEGDIFLNGAYFVESGKPLKKSPFNRKNKIPFKPGTYAGRLTRYAGALRCRAGKPC